MSIKCPKHEMEVISMWEKDVEVKTGYKQVAQKIMRVVTSKCPVFGCGFSVESDQYGVVIRDSIGGS